MVAGTATYPVGYAIEIPWMPDVKDPPSGGGADGSGVGETIGDGVGGAGVGEALGDGGGGALGQS